MKKRVVIIIGIIAVFSLVMACVAFYVVPLVKANQCVGYANRNCLEDDYEGTLISAENIKKLQVVDEEIIKQQDYYINIVTETDYTIQSLNKVSIMWDINVTAYKDVIESDSIKYNQKCETVIEFKNFEWVITSVNIIE